MIKLHNPDWLSHFMTIAYNNNNNKDFIYRGGHVTAEKLTNLWPSVAYRSSFNFARTLDLGSINFVLNKRSFAASIRKKLFVSVWAQDNDKNDILRWRIRLSHNGFHEE